jgi:Fe-Mn family superoxide dismutase
MTAQRAARIPGIDSEPFSLPPLPYPEDALAPAISRETLAYHHGRHHRGYVRTLNELLAGSPLRGLSLRQLAKKAEGSLFNCAAQAWNHAFYWQCLSPERGLRPSGALGQRIRDDFGSVDALLQALRASALAKFASGWTWLVRRKDGSLAIENTADADTPIRRAGHAPLFVCDVWEHAYYLDYRNERARYVDSVLGIVNWDFVAANFTDAGGTS